MLVLLCVNEFRGKREEVTNFMQEYNLYHVLSLVIIKKDSQTLKVNGSHLGNGHIMRHIFLKMLASCFRSVYSLKD